MTTIAFQDGKIVMRDGKVGTEQGCCCEEEEYDCDVNCNKTITVNWSNNGASGTLTYTIAERGAFVQITGLRVSSTISCRNTVDGKWFISVVMCAGPPYTSGSCAAIISALSDGCPPDGAVTWTTNNLGAGSDASASIS